MVFSHERSPPSTMPSTQSGRAAAVQPGVVVQSSLYLLPIYGDTCTNLKDGVHQIEKLTTTAGNYDLESH